MWQHLRTDSCKLSWTCCELLNYCCCSCCGWFCLLLFIFLFGKHFKYLAGSELFTQCFKGSKNTLKSAAEHVCACPMLLTPLKRTVEVSTSIYTLIYLSMVAAHFEDVVCIEKAKQTQKFQCRGGRDWGSWGRDCCWHFRSMRRLNWNYLRTIKSNLAFPLPLPLATIKGATEGSSSSRTSSKGCLWCWWWRWRWWQTKSATHAVWDLKWQQQWLHTPHGRLMLLTN